MRKFSPGFRSVISPFLPTKSKIDLLNHEDATLKNVTQNQIFLQPGHFEILTQLCLLCKNQARNHAYIFETCFQKIISEHPLGPQAYARERLLICLKI